MAARDPPVDAAFGHDAVEQHVVRRFGEAGDLLRLEGDPDEPRPAPGAAMAKELEVPVIEPGAHAEPVAARVEADERHEHEVEPARVDAFAAGILRRGDEAHAPIAQARDHREYTRQPRRAARRSTIAGSISPSNGWNAEMRVPGLGSPRRASARSIAAAAAGRSDADTARRAARSRRRSAGRSSAMRTRERRHPPVPSWAAALDTEQQVEQAAAFKAFRYEADLHNATAEPGSWVFHIRVERYPGPHRTPQVAPNFRGSRLARAPINQLPSEWLRVSTPSTRSRMALSRAARSVSTTSSWPRA